MENANNSPAFIFTGKDGGDDVPLRRLFFEYPLTEIKENTEAFFDSVKSIYQQEKFQNPINSGKMMDLGNHDDLMRMRRHLRVHAITGLPELGTSTTESIPYWDRQGFVAGLRYAYGDDWEYYQQRIDLESINALRSMLSIYIPKYCYAKMCMDNLHELRYKDERFTRGDISHSISKQFDAWKEITENYKRVLIGKIKHLVFCLDKMIDRDIRMFGLQELDAFVVAAGFEVEELTINLGVDGGVIKSTYRPVYQIHMHTQLRHLGVDVVSVPDSVNVEWGLPFWKRRLSRLACQDSFLEEPSEFILDWRFE